MDKKMYNKPELTVVKMPPMPHLLAGSDHMEGGGDNAGSGTNTNNPSPRASFSTLDIEE